MKFILIDGNSFCYRAFYAIRELRSSKGEPTNAIYGFITMLEKVIAHVKPDGVALTFDVKGPTFRHKRYQEYKIQRSPMPEDLVLQMPLIKEVVEAMNIPIFEKQGYEADDVIATLARRIEEAGHETYIVTGDKDSLQLVNQKTKVLNPQKENLIYGEEEVRVRFGVEPSRVVEVMALSGDASDNIPGVPGIGEKTAMKLIEEFHDLEGVLKNISKIKGDKLKENLEKYKDQARLSRELALLDRQVPLTVDLKALERRAVNTAKLGELYKRFEFRSLLKEMPDAEKKNDSDPTLVYTLVQDAKAWNHLKQDLASHKEWAFDFETTGVDAMTARPIGVSFCFKEKEAYYVAFAESGPLSAKACLGSIQPLFENEKIQKIGQNIKYEMLILKNLGIELRGVAFDTMVASYCLNTSKPNHNLDDIAMEHLGVRITDIHELIGSGRQQITMDRVPLDQLSRYGCQDSDVTFRLSKILKAKLVEKDLWGLFQDIEMPLVSVLADMEFAGVAIDEPLLAGFSKEMEKSLASLTSKIYGLAEAEFNINSPKQLQEILFEKLKLPMVKKTKTGASTDVGVLLELSEIHPLPREILKFRELSKLKSTYVDALPLLVNPSTKRVHTSFNQTVTATGRLSSSDPNVQNIPVRTEEGRKIRRAFIAGSLVSAAGKTSLISADYSQIELRVLAHMSGDEHLIKAFRQGADVHRFTASLIFNCDIQKVTDSMREQAKTVNFGVLYGMGAFSLAKTLEISNEAARDFIKAYFDRYGRVKGFLDGLVEAAKKDGFVSTCFKRRRYIPEISSRDGRLRSFAERTAINAPIQGTASDVIKIAMNRIAARLVKDKFKARMLLQVHDELLFETPHSEQKDLAAMVRDQMRSAVSFQVPMEVEIKAGPNWLDMKEI